MGILVPNCTLPNGIVITDAFICFTGEKVIVQKDVSGETYCVVSTYRVYKDSTRTGPVIILCPIIVEGITNVVNSPYNYLYDSLKQTYPGSVDEN
jgi:hypothetical protein